MYNKEIFTANLLWNTSLLCSVKKKKSNSTFYDTGFNTWKKAGEKLSNHSISHVHREAKMKWITSGKPTPQEHFSPQMLLLQKARIKALL